MNQKPVNINEASKLCGLSPSVLRIWELRYGWPGPKRKPNGYRSYSSHQIDELKRMADLVKSGMPISSLIVDGLPRWPANHVPVAGPKQLPTTRHLPSPGSRQAAGLRDELVEAVETRRGAVIDEILQRCNWVLRPAEEAPAVLAPALVGLAELASHGPPLKEAAAVRSRVKQRGMQLLRQLRAKGEPVWVVPLHEDDQALAVIATILLNQRGQAAQPWLEGEHPENGQLVLASDGALPDRHEAGNRVLGRIAGIGDGEVVGLAELLDLEHPLPWHTSTV